MGSNRPKALIVHLDESLLIRLEGALETSGISTTTTWDPDQGCHELASGQYDVLLVGHHPPQIDAHDALKCAGTVPCLVILARPTHPFEQQYWECAGAAAAIPMWALDAIVTKVKICVSAPDRQRDIAATETKRRAAGGSEHR